MYKFSVQPVLNPFRQFIIVIHNAFPLLKQGIVHFAFGGCDYQFELLINAVVDVFAGIVIKNVVVDVLSEPKSMTATDLFPLLELYIKAHLAVKVAVQDTLSNPT
jgi:phage-related holin